MPLRRKESGPPTHRDCQLTPWNLCASRSISLAATGHGFLEEPKKTDFDLRGNSLKGSLSSRNLRDISPVHLRHRSPHGNPHAGTSCVCTRLCESGVSCATANIPNPRHRPEKVPLEQSRLFPCCNLTHRWKRARHCNDCPTSFLQMILRVAQTVVWSHWVIVRRALKSRF